MIRDGYSYLLPSGRGVRLVELLPSEVDSITKKAAKLVGIEEGSVADFRVAALHEGVCQMIKEITVEAKCKSSEQLLDPKTKWKPVDLADLDENYDKYFKAKDDAILAALYRKLHEVSAAEIEAIAGKAIPISGD